MRLSVFRFLIAHWFMLSVVQAFRFSIAIHSSIRFRFSVAQKGYCFQVFKFPGFGFSICECQGFQVFGHSMCQHVILLLYMDIQDSKCVGTFAGLQFAVDYAGDADLQSMRSMCMSCCDPRPRC